MERDQGQQLGLWKASDPILTEQATYQPLPSIWSGNDAELLERMLDFYPRGEPQKILDATVNRGRFWKGSRRHVIGLDIDPQHRPTVVGNNLQMPFADGSFDVVVYDPPHVPNQGQDKSKDFNGRFGLVLKSPAKNGYNFSHLYGPLSVRRTEYWSMRGSYSQKSPTMCMAIGFNGPIFNWYRRPRRSAFALAIVS